MTRAAWSLRSSSRFVENIQSPHGQFICDRTGALRALMRAIEHPREQVILEHSFPRIIDDSSHISWAPMDYLFLIRLQDRSRCVRINEGAGGLDLPDNRDEKLRRRPVRAVPRLQKTDCAARTSNVSHNRSGSESKDYLHDLDCDGFDDSNRS